MDMDVLKTFVTLATVGHMTRASEKLHLSQPAVSAQLKRLERELGQVLFERTPRGMDLTESGQVFLLYAKEAMNSLERGQEALDELADLHRGSLSLGGGATAITYLLPPILKHFHETYPGIHLFIREQGSSQTLQRVLAGELDLGLITLPQNGVLPNAYTQKLELVPWLEDELHLILPPKHTFGRRRNYHWKELDGQPMVLFEAGSAVREMIDARFVEAGIQPRVVMELRSIESIKQMVEQGIGMGFLTRYALKKKRRGLRCKEKPLTRKLAIVYRKDRGLRRAAKTFLEFMKPEASQSEHLEL